ncbi:MAG: ATP-binding protein [Planctomycetes bacterium]|nr:ATP-binding protein [Planctomycetota bacterium]
MTDDPSRPVAHLPRAAPLRAWLEQKSHFLFGPRQTGKSSWIRRSLPEVRLYDLLDSRVFGELSHRPARIGEELTAADSMVVIDEIQRLPVLLNEVHRLIEARGTRFLLTGSSARTLRRGGLNLLGGRARTKYLHPLTTQELGESFDLSRAVRRGTLPSIWFSDDPKADLDAYAGTYLQQEIVAEGATRNASAFSRFLHVAAHCNATMINFTKIGNDAQVPRTTVYEYFEILKDTLLIHEVPAFGATKKRKPIATSKYYFFDVGVVSALQGRLVEPGTPEFGSAFETWFAHELLAHRDYISGEPIRYWRSTSGYEVDFIVGDHTAIEVKAKENVSAADLRSLEALAEEKLLKRYVCVSLEARRRRVGQVEMVPYREFLAEMWG